MPQRHLKKYRSCFTPEPHRIEQSRAKGVGTIQGETYLSHRFDVLLEKTRNEGHTTLRNCTVEEVLGQGRYHLEKG